MFVIGIVDYGMGNLLSVYHALDMVGAEATLCDTPAALEEVERIILPGVGAFRDCIANLEKQGFVAALNEMVYDQGKPILGICLGMEVMAQRSFEGGEYHGLSWFEADVVRIETGDPALRVPHVGWNNIYFSTDNPLFRGLPASPDFYFVHSYHLQCHNEGDVVATCNHGTRITAAVQKGNIFATQFHPEKSQDYGLRVLENFLDWNPA
jgi:glutamine amidotransferase